MAIPSQIGQSPRISHSESSGGLEVILCRRALSVICLQLSLSSSASQQRRLVELAELAEIAECPECHLRLLAAARAWWSPLALKRRGGRLERSKLPIPLYAGSGHLRGDAQAHPRRPFPSWENSAQGASLAGRRASWQARGSPGRPG